MLTKLIYCSNQKLWFYLSILNLALFISCSSNSGSIDNFNQDEQTAFDEDATNFVPKSWQYAEGRIYRTEAIADDGKKLWSSTKSDNWYSEISETNDEVILDGNDFQVKLTADACYRKMPNEDWTYLYRGGWEFIEDYEAFKNDLMAPSDEVPIPPPPPLDEVGTTTNNAGNNESNDIKKIKTACYKCGGSGLKECFYCHGRVDVQCLECHGLGELGYSNDKRICNICGGKGKVQCNYCYGKGTNGSCGICNGKGYLEQ